MDGTCSECGTENYDQDLTHSQPGKDTESLQLGMKTIVWNEVYMGRGSEAYSRGRLLHLVVSSKMFTIVSVYCNCLHN